MEQHNESVRNEYVEFINNMNNFIKKTESIMETLEVFKKASKLTLDEWLLMKNKHDEKENTH